MDARKFDGVDRASKQVLGATTVGVTFSKFGELLQPFAAEILMVKNKVRNDKERTLLALYVSALEKYQDSYMLWKWKVGPSGYNDAQAIFEKYKVEIAPNERPMVVLEKMVQDFWTSAGKDLEAADRQLQ